MKRLVNVSVGEFSIPRPSWYYINNASDFKVRCEIKHKNLGIFKDRYLLQLEGSEENIQMFLDYLKYEKFKIQ